MIGVNGLPKITFYNLPDEKRQLLIESAKREFSRVPLFEASISNIVKSAGIPRGSFYQYFEDKEDIFFFLLNDSTKQMKDHFVLTLENCDGDIFEAMIEIFQIIVKEEENIHFLKNAFLNMTYKVEKSFGKIIGDSDRSESYREIGHLVNKKYMNVSDDHEFFHAMEIIMSLTIRNIVKKFALEIPFSQALETYKMEINLIKNGLYR